ncbi:MAG TPA: hypothetical protein DHV28_13410 [Ignavibacteriales bacterium]|nr:hypothetical protein [Ignavibacteriales bacterium]
MNNRIKIIIILFLSIIQVNICLAQKNSSENFDSLLQESDAVILEDNFEIEVPDNYTAEYIVSRKILIKNSKADNFCRVVVFESEFQEIEELEASLTNKNGKIIKELESDDIKEADYSADAFYSGTRYKYFELHHFNYPFIFEYQYKVTLRTLMLWPDWLPQKNIPTINSTYKLIINPNVKFKYYIRGIDIKPVLKSESSFDVYDWKLENIPATLEEDYISPEDEIQKAVYFVAQKFYTDDYEGSTDSWDDYSDWYRSLTLNRYNLSFDAQEEVFRLIKDVPEPKEKIRILYKYLQKKNRYVAIEMGLAGWQPQSAEQVYLNHYGDCKDLSTYMVAILKVAGIKSYPALALTRDKGIVYLEQPSNQFNHVIVFVPLDNDTVWLECTSAYNDMGDLPSSIEEINTLVIGEYKGELIKTPQKKSYQNKWTSTIKGSFWGAGDLKFEAVIYTSGNQKIYLRNNLVRSNSKDDILFMNDVLSRNYSNLSISDFNSEESEKVETEDYIIRLTGMYSRFVPQMNDRIFVNPGIFNRKSERDLPKEEISKRKYPVYFKYPFKDIDTVVIALPLGYTMESKPQNHSIEKSFASYSTEFELRDKDLVYVRTFEQIKNHIPLNEYPEFYNFMKQVIEFDKAKFVLKRN